MGIDNLNDPRAADRSLRRSSAVQGTASPGGNTSISEGAFEIRSNEGLLVSGSAKVDGWLIVTGTERVTGLLEILGQLVASGTIKLTGTTRFEGDTTQVGPFHIQGATDITGALSVNGLTTLLKTLTVSTGGKIVVGNMVLDPAVGGSGAVGGISAPAVIFLDAPGVVVNHGLQVNDNLSSNGGVSMLNLPTTTTAANLNVATTFGTVSRVTSASKYKLSVREMNIPDALLDVPVKDWVDRSAKDRLAWLRRRRRPLTSVEQCEADGHAHTLKQRVPGVIAEDVAAAGGEAFVTYDADGEIDGVAYDRFALARTQILATRLDQALARIDELEKKLAS